MPKGGRKTRPGLQVVQRPGRTALYLRGTVRGISVFESAGTDDPALAEEARAAREAELYRGAVHGFQPRMTFAGAALSYLRTVEPSPATLVNVGKLTRHFGPGVTCDTIKQAEIDAARRSICRPTAKPATVQRQVVTPVTAILNHAARRGWCDPPHFERAKAGGKRTDWLTPAEAEAMIAAAAKHLKPLLTFLFSTGARLGEAVALAWKDVDLQRARAVLRGTKNGDDQLLDLPPRAVVALAGLSGDRTGNVFRHRRSRTYRENDGVAYGGQIKRAFATALRLGGIKRHLTPHHTRHSWATWHYAAYRDLMLLREKGNWHSVTMCERYAKLAPDGIGAEALTFWGILAKSVPSAYLERKIG